MPAEHEDRRQGGMLSASDIRGCIVKPEDEDEYLDLFTKRKWKVIKSKWPPYEKGLVIKGYNELNLTPFSYDMSIGNQLFSIQEPTRELFTFNEDDPGRREYHLDPGETVVVITRELVAIPRHYSATMWPRFSLVRDGIFQSMVKIDPTWYGKLAVAITNVSPAVIGLETGKAFATLVLYELSKPSDVDLWKPSELVEADVEVPTDFSLDGFDRFLSGEPELGKRCRLVGRTLKLKGIKRGDVESLKHFHGSDAWAEFAERRVGEGWAKFKHPETGRRMIGMDGLGMSDLQDILKGPGRGTRITESDIVGRACTEQDLAAAARRYGKPFDVFAAIPHTVSETVEREVLPRLSTQIESGIQSRMVMLMFSVLGFLSLIVAVLALVARSDSLEAVGALALSPWYWGLVLIVAAVVVLGFAFLAFKTRWGLRLPSTGSVEKLGSEVKHLAQRLGKIENLDKDIKRLEAMCRALKDAQPEAQGPHDGLGEAPVMPGKEVDGERNNELPK